MRPMERNQVFIEENTPRDGLQNEAVLLSLEERVALVDALSTCGFGRIQIGSFVNPKRVPQMAHTEELYRRVRKVPGVVYSALVLNRKGLERAAACGIPHVSLYVSASETHSLKNSNRSVADALREAIDLMGEARGHGLRVRAGVMNAFGCQFEGRVPFQRVLEIVQRFLALDVDEVSLADTAGVAHPQQVEEAVARAREICPVPLSLHFHETYGFGLANVYAAWRAGGRHFDASCGGLGGCPFIPGVAGNVATEDVLHLFEEAGIDTGVSLVELSRVVAQLEARLGRSLPGRYARLAKSSERVGSCEGSGTA